LRVNHLVRRSSRRRNTTPVALPVQTWFQGSLGPLAEITAGCVPKPLIRRFSTYAIKRTFFGTFQERLASRDASGLSIDEFCVDEDVSRSTFYRWVTRLKDGIPDAVKEEGANLTLAEIAEPKFLPVSVTASPVGLVSSSG